MASPLTAQKIDPDGKAAAAAAAAPVAPVAASVATPAPVAAKKADEKATATADDDDDKPMQSFEGPEKVLEIWWTETPLTGHVAAQPGDAYKRSGLRTIAVAKLKVLLEEVKCCILSSVSNAHVDAYLLSESSMFVYPFQIVLKTCGTTTLLKAVQPLLALARDECGLVDLNNVFYCRKNFLDPTKQLYPHTSWEHECTELGTVFNGDGHVMGNTTGDHWFLYTTDNKAGVSVLSPTYKPPPSPQLAALNSGAAVAAAATGNGSATPAPVKVTPPPSNDAKQANGAAAAAAAGGVAGVAAAATTTLAAPTPLSLEAALAACTSAQRKEVAQYLTKLLSRPVNTSGAPGSPSLRGVASATNLAMLAMGGGGTPPTKGDVTLELLMSELDQTKMKIFTKTPGVDAKTVTRQSGIGALYPDALIDEFVFDPQGYSMNGIRDSGYFTIHITPQPNCSYASFETNIENHQGDYAPLITQNLAIFGPGKFTVILFTTHDLADVSRNSVVFIDFPGYSRSGMHVAPFQTYTVTYCHYQKTKR